MSINKELVRSSSTDPFSPVDEGENIHEEMLDQVLAAKEVDNITQVTNTNNIPSGMVLVPVDQLAEIMKELKELKAKVDVPHTPLFPVVTPSTKRTIIDLHREVVDDETPANTQKKSSIFSSKVTGKMPIMKPGEEDRRRPLDLTRSKEASRGFRSEDLTRSEDLFEGIRPIDLTRSGLTRPEEEMGKKSYSTLTRAEKSIGGEEFHGDSYLTEIYEQKFVETQEKVEELQRQIQVLTQSGNLLTSDQIAKETGSCFTWEVTEAQVPDVFEMPHLPTFDGTADPIYHLKVYKDGMKLKKAVDAVLCLAFSSTLRGRALSWFSKIPSRSIHCFKELETLFCNHFLRNRKNAPDLRKIVQKPGETLKSYAERFGAALDELPDVPVKEALEACCAGMENGGSFLQIIRHCPPTTVAELHQRLRIQVDYEEEENIKKLRSGKTINTSSSQNQMKLRTELKGRMPISGSGQSQTEKVRLEPQEIQRLQAAKRKEGLIPLTKPVSLIFFENRSSGIFKPPRKMLRPLEQRNTEKYCEYHSDVGHTTNECWHLIAEIQNLVSTGALAHYARKTAPPRYNRVPFNYSHDSVEEEEMRIPQRRRTQPSQYNVNYGAAGVVDDCYQIMELPKEEPRRPVKERLSRGSVYDRLGPTNYMITGGFVLGESEPSMRAHKEYVREVFQLQPELKKRRTGTAIVFGDYDRQGLLFPHTDPLVIHLGVRNHIVKRVFVDDGSAADILYLHTFKKLGLDTSNLTPYPKSLLSFGGNSITPLGSVILPVTFKDDKSSELEASVTVEVNFLVVDIKSPFNILLGRPGIHKVGGIPSTFYQCFKFPTSVGIGVIRGDQKHARELNLECMKGKNVEKTDLSRRGGAPALQLVNEVNEMDTREELKEPLRPKPVVDLKPLVLVEGEADKVTYINPNLSPKMREELEAIIKENADLFAFQPSDMPGVDPRIAVHKLHIQKGFKPVQQKKRNSSSERCKIIEEEVDKILKAGFIKEVKFPTWLANVVLVKKSNGKWRLCIDFTDLNKACPKDCFPLPRTDDLVDKTSGYEMLSFLDAYSGYHQIFLDPEDAEKTAFITDKGTYHYVTMPFGLKNAGATYQRMVNQVFKEQIGRNLEAYVDDAVIKSKKEKDHLEDLKETFATLRKYNLRLNPAKCAFGVPSGKFLGFMVSHRGIEVNPEKIRAIMEMQPPRTLREVQVLTGRVAALSRFIAKTGDRCHPFFQAIKRRKSFSWDEECQGAFEDLKRYLSSPPLLKSPLQGEVLFVYLAVTEKAVSAVLIKEEDKVQFPVYYTSHVLLDAETRYSKPEKFILCLIRAARRLRPYFQAHPVVVLTDQPLKQILHRPDTSGRLMKWTIELSEYGIEFQPRTSIKGQALADFVVECTIPDHPENDEKVGDFKEAAVTHPESSHPLWALYVDGSSAQGACGAGLLLQGPHEVEIAVALRFTFQVSNNEAEYEALLAGLSLAEQVGVKLLKIFSDSQLVVSQIQGNFEAKNERMAKYVDLVKKRIQAFEAVEVIHIPREENTRADALSKLTMMDFPQISRKVILEVLRKRGIEEEKQIGKEEPDVMEIDGAPTWMDPIKAYIKDGELPTDPKKARGLKFKAARYVLFEDELYRRSLTAPLLRCISRSQGEQVLREVHAGLCGSHIGAQSLGQKVLRMGFYWPNIQEDAKVVVQSCDACQRYANVIHNPANPLTSIESPVPFAMWGLDLLGPFPKAKGGCQFIVVAIDYFTKWIEARALASTTMKQMKKFLFEDIICRYGLPRVVITDNGPQFAGGEFSQYCEDMGIQHRFTSVAHPRANGQVEVSNRTILKGLKARFGHSQSSWVEDLHNVLWSYRTTPSRATGETPFLLAYGTEALVPMEVYETSPRIKFSELKLSDEGKLEDDGLRSNLDLLEEVRDRALSHNTVYKQRVAKYFNKKVHSREFQVGDLVLRRAEAAGHHVGKLDPNWEGPFQVAKILRPGSYALKDLEGNSIPRSWSIDNLKRYFV